MTQYNIVPKGGRRSGWKVEANGRETSQHNKKQPAIDAAYARAAPGDTLVIHGLNGLVQERREVR